MEGLTRSRCQWVCDLLPTDADWAWCCALATAVLEEGEERPPSARGVTASSPPAVFLDVAARVAAALLDFRRGCEAKTGLEGVEDPAFVEELR